MLTTIFYHSVEFYVVAAVIAAAVLALSAMPRRRGAVTTHLLAGTVESDAAEAPEEIEIECLDNRNVCLRRRGVRNIGTEGAVSLAASVNGLDIVIKERAMPGLSNQNEPVMATFELDFIAPERYHIRYENEDTGMFAAFTLTNRPGVKITRELKN